MEVKRGDYVGEIVSNDRKDLEKCSREGGRLRMQLSRRILYGAGGMGSSG